MIRLAWSAGHTARHGTAACVRSGRDGTRGDRPCSPNVRRRATFVSAGWHTARRHRQQQMHGAVVGRCAGSLSRSRPTAGGNVWTWRGRRRQQRQGERKGVTGALALLPAQFCECVTRTLGVGGTAPLPLPVAVCSLVLCPQLCTVCVCVGCGVRCKSQLRGL